MNALAGVAANANATVAEQANRNFWTDLIGRPLPTQALVNNSKVHAKVRTFEINGLAGADPRLVIIL
jgi:hypothetical protein